MAQSVERLPTDSVAPRAAVCLNGRILSPVEPDLEAASPAEGVDPLVGGSAVGLLATALCPAHLTVRPALTSGHESGTCLAWHVLTFFSCCG